MSIYDVKFYGAYVLNRRGICDVKVAKSSDLRIRPGSVTFELTVLKEFAGKKNVLRLQFKEGDVEYETLYDPGYFYEDGVWKETNCRQVQNAFLKTYGTLNAEIEFYRKVSIFYMTFYVAVEDGGTAKPKMEVSLNSLKRVGGLRELFTATVRSQLYGEEYVLELKSEAMDGCEYVPLFKPDRRYSLADSKWVKCRKSKIPEKIIECYIKHVNE